MSRLRYTEEDPPESDQSSAQKSWRSSDSLSESPPSLVDHVSEQRYGATAEHQKNGSHTRSRQSSFNEENSAEAGLSKKEPPVKQKYSSRQWMVLIVLAMVNFGQAICMALQAPFYPAEAESKGATATEYGLVFGVFELTIFLVSPFYGKYMMAIGPKFLLNAGVFATATCCFLFGFLDKVYGREAFVGLSFAIRIVQGMGEAAYMTASFALIAKEFPDRVATTFAALETCFGLGIIAGPTIGGALYQVGGYILPFTVMGSFLFFGGCVTFMILPAIEELQSRERPSVLAVLRIVPVFLATLTTFCGACSIGFIAAALEPHLRQFGLQPIENGAMFVISGTVYALTAPVWGFLCDKTGQTKLYCAIGALSVSISFTLLGPAPYIPLEPQLWLCGVALIFQGIGVGGEIVCGFLGSLKEAIKHGQADNLGTYGLISALWSSTFALGAFIGPSIAGLLLDTVGFRYGTLFIIAEHLLLATVMFSYMTYRKCNNRSKSTGYSNIVDHNERQQLLDKSTTKNTDQ